MIPKTYPVLTVEDMGSVFALAVTRPLNAAERLQAAEKDIDPDERSMSVCITGADGTNGVEKELAFLFAAAPDLLAACKAFVTTRMLEGTAETASEHEAVVDEFSRVEELALDAIAKAEGREA